MIFHTCSANITHPSVTRACNSVVECSLRMREVGGSIPLKSIIRFFNSFLFSRFACTSVCSFFPIVGKEFECYDLLISFLYAFAYPIYFLPSPVFHSSSSRQFPAAP
ncbi:hypothetical protein BDV36DRAFT_249885 [Aspergillus pseudocaelatus]|uniref:Uncharacterized protein n=1 Tax=Aspergillus pseudocaelatus TaxID=1825620 RepID=A0ABQ6WWZ8_9EURO|nr:hypothetical protein BDV36DRAFT_249885 [Aspergillus pseudocaelatus]